MLWKGGDRRKIENAFFIWNSHILSNLVTLIDFYFKISYKTVEIIYKNDLHS